MAIAFISSTHITPSGTTGGTSPNFNSTGADLITVVVEGVTPFTVADNQGNTYTPRTAVGESQIWDCSAPVTSATHTVTITGLVSSAEIATWSGTNTSSVFDVENGASFSNQAGSVTPSQNGSLIIAGIGQQNTATFSIDSGFTVQEQFGGSGVAVPGALAYLIQSTAGAVDPLWTVTGGGGFSSSVIAVYKPAGGTSPTVSAVAGAATFAAPAPTVTGTVGLPEEFANLAETTVATGGYTAGSGILNVASTALPFPQVGIFRVAINDPTSVTVKVILAVTGINSSTQFAVSAEGADANALHNDLVTAVLTAGAILHLRSDISGAGAFADLPSTTHASIGDRYMARDGFAWRFDGLVWVPVGDAMKMKKPVVGSYTAVNLATASLTDGSNGLYARDAANESGLHIWKLAAPSAPYTLSVRVRGFVEQQSGKAPGFGIGFRHNSDGKFEALMVGNNFSTGFNPGTWIGVDYWTTATTFSAALAGPTRFNEVASDVWLRIVDDNTNKLFKFSLDGVNWETILSETRTTNFTADEIGFFIKTDGAVQIVSAVFRSWEVS